MRHSSMMFVKPVSKKWVMVMVYSDCEEVVTEKKIPVTIKTEKRIQVMMIFPCSRSHFPCSQSLMLRKKDPKGGGVAVMADLRLLVMR